MNEVSNRKTKAAIISYAIGFVLSIALTLVAFMLVRQHVESGHVQLSHDIVTMGITGFAVVQLVVQLVFFLHLGQESRPRWNLVAFLFMLIVLIIVVFGSLWIMENLNYNMMEMAPEESKQYMQDHQGGF